ncbi:MAG: hypothetical protein IPL59_19805 [Candidatus Competibacteraceae bacterium]|uniref:HTH OST-type domain-containing protein n=1 Tax=Candidatus Contendobacter odensis Run_B_J11 TaxID=1400861 RepID=A0A7U7GAJ1_9GAMM|nr:hypothetical protein [Candidatus Contendobacter odensis]MBK8537143.1 hypothetical protein [Candidatus Competibacteraceae bacterium]CDH44601.1 conserved hypothetical protein [Candidatus Contendobacter odensis Run_B_J11]
MEIDIELEKLKNEVLRKIGRNVMLFQQMEHMLKCLLASNKISGYASELKTNHEQRITKIHKQTMGQVVGQYIEGNFSAPKEATNLPEELKEPWFYFRYAIESDDVFYYEKRKMALASLVAERNDLIHHLLPKWNTRSFESSTETELYLDQQREKILLELEALKAEINAIKEFAVFLVSNECKKHIELSLLRQSQLVVWLFEIAQQKARSDGWVVLSNAAHSIHQHFPEELTNLEERYGHKKLKAIILATEFFDITQESTDKGGIRVLYRIKPDLNFTD